MHIPTFLHKNKFMKLMEVTSFLRTFIPNNIFSQPYNKHEYNHSLTIYSLECHF